MKERIIEKYRDWKAGVYDDIYDTKVTWKTVCKKEGFEYSYAKNVASTNC